MWILKRKSLFCECFKCPERSLLPRRELAQTNPTSTRRNAKKERGGREEKKRREGKWKMCVKGREWRGKEAWPTTCLPDLNCMASCPLRQISILAFPVNKDNNFPSSLLPFFLPSLPLPSLAFLFGLYVSSNGNQWPPKC